MLPGPFMVNARTDVLARSFVEGAHVVSARDGLYVRFVVANAGVFCLPGGVVGELPSEVLSAGPLGDSHGRWSLASPAVRSCELWMPVLAEESEVMASGNAVRARRHSGEGEASRQLRRIRSVLVRLLILRCLLLRWLLRGSVVVILGVVVFLTMRRVFCPMRCLLWGRGIVPVVILAAMLPIMRRSVRDLIPLILPVLLLSVFILIPMMSLLWDVVALSVCVLLMCLRWFSLFILRVLRVGVVRLLWSLGVILLVVVLI